MADQVRLSMDGTAAHLGISRRTLQKLLGECERAHPGRSFYFPAGRRKLFTEADLTRLEETIRWLSNSGREREADAGISAAPSEASLWTRVRELRPGT